MSTRTKDRIERVAGGGVVLVAATLFSAPYLFLLIAALVQ